MKLFRSMRGFVLSFLVCGFPLVAQNHRYDRAYGADLQQQTINNAYLRAGASRPMTRPQALENLERSQRAQAEFEASMRNMFDGIRRDLREESAERQRLRAEEDADREAAYRRAEARAEREERAAEEERRERRASRQEQAEEAEGAPVRAVDEPRASVPKVAPRPAVRPERASEDGPKVGSSVQQLPPGTSSAVEAPVRTSVVDPIVRETFPDPAVDPTVDDPGLTWRGGIGLVPASNQGVNVGDPIWRGGQGAFDSLVPLRAVSGQSETVQLEDADLDPSWASTFRSAFREPTRGGRKFSRAMPAAQPPATNRSGMQAVGQFMAQLGDCADSVGEAMDAAGSRAAAGRLLFRDGLQRIHQAAKDRLIADDRMEAGKKYDRMLVLSFPDMLINRGQFVEDWMNYLHAEVEKIR